MTKHILYIPPSGQHPANYVVYFERPDTQVKNTITMEQFNTLETDYGLVQGEDYKGLSLNA